MAGGKEWILDSGCTDHMTGDKDMFRELAENDDPRKYVTFGDNSKGKVVGLGKVAISHDSSIQNVILVYDFSRFTWVFFLDDKSQVQKIFKNFARKAQNQFEVKIKRFAATTERSSRTQMWTPFLMKPHFTSERNCWIAEVFLGPRQTTALSFSGRKDSMEM